MVAALNELAADGYVARSPDPKDKRRNVITVTERGHARAAELTAVASKVQEDLLAPLSAADRRQLTTLLRTLLQHHDAGRTPEPQPGRR